MVAPGFVDRANGDLRPTASALVINAATDPGTSAKGVSLAPVAQYKATASGETRPVAGVLDIGAYETMRADANAAAITWTACVNEGATCTFSGTREVRYGANGTFSTKVFTGSTVCSNTVFGDPVHGVLKTCSYSSTPLVTTGTSTGTTVDTAATAPVTTDASWTACAAEGGLCTVSGTKQVRFGASGRFTTRTVTGSIACTPAAFGGDPAYRVVKSCSVANATR